MIYAIFMLLASASANEPEKLSDPDRVAGECVSEKAQAYAHQAGTAEAIANLIAAQCSELLPHSSNKDCGKVQNRCDLITQETNEMIRDEMAKLAYRIIVIFRQGR